MTLTDPLHTVDEGCIISVQSCPSELLEKRELRQMLSDAIAQLTPTRKKVLHLRYNQGLQVKEIATRLNRSEGTIKSHLYNVHHQLRGLVGAYIENGAPLSES